MSLLSVLQSEHAALVLGFLHDNWKPKSPVFVLLEVARPIRNSPAFAWVISTYHDFTLNKVDANLRTDALCRRMLSRYMCVNFPDKFTRVWSGVPNAIMIQPGFAQFFHNAFHTQFTKVGDGNQYELNGIEEYEFQRENDARVAIEREYSDEEDAAEAWGDWRARRWVVQVQQLYVTTRRRHLVNDTEMCVAYEHAMRLGLDSSAFRVPRRLAP